MISSDIDHHKISNKIMDLLDKIDDGKTICPSEVARSLSPEHWRDWMPSVHRAANEMVNSGSIIITQKGIPVSPNNRKGAYRIKKNRK